MGVVFGCVGDGEAVSVALCDMCGVGDLWL